MHVCPCSCSQHPHYPLPHTPYKQHSMQVILLSKSPGCPCLYGKVRLREEGLGVGVGGGVGTHTHHAGRDGLVSLYRWEEEHDDAQGEGFDDDDARGGAWYNTPPLHTSSCFWHMNINTVMSLACCCCCSDTRSIVMRILLMYQGDVQGRRRKTTCTPCA